MGTAADSGGSAGTGVRGRLEPLREGRLTKAQREMWDELGQGPRGATAVRPEGFLTGPFDVLLRSPRIGRAVAGLGALLRYDSELEPRHRELVILTVAARWHADFAWLRHDLYGRNAGLPEAAIRDIAAGKAEPGFDKDADRVVHAFVHQLVHTGAVDRERYDAALALLGERPLVELVSLTGYYCLSSMVLNAFEVPLPEGASVPWPPRASDPPAAP
ncbi:hypothetical protein OG552_16910 [Streptomyces sp. NBC_01476]|uniref:carboxymuconolactone decarboxylase family protein n=1 Tax=Streptomyces sp. NBC_01476 TaxID=2903881 RepID=UPI002E321792|nr:hypothetical protein [Streptomyces sp. NBC_01476]